jgi:hypothetical protein
MAAAPMEDLRKNFRRVFCEHYGTCLDYAIKREWQGFSCVYCSAYSIEKKSSKEWASEARRCSKLVKAVVPQRVTKDVGSYDSNIQEMNEEKVFDPVRS